jgi:hypothetical protein
MAATSTFTQQGVRSLIPFGLRTIVGGASNPLMGGAVGGIIGGTAGGPLGAIAGVAGGNWAFNKQGGIFGGDHLGGITDFLNKIMGRGGPAVTVSARGEQLLKTLSDSHVERYLAKRDLRNPPGTTYGYATGHKGYTQAVNRDIKYRIGRPSHVDDYIRMREARDLPGTTYGYTGKESRVYGRAVDKDRALQKRLERLNRTRHADRTAINKIRSAGSVIEKYTNNIIRDANTFRAPIEIATDGIRRTGVHGILDSIGRGASFLGRGAGYTVGTFADFVAKGHAIPGLAAISGPVGLIRHMQRITTPEYWQRMTAHAAKIDLARAKLSTEGANKIQKDILKEFKFKPGSSGMAVVARESLLGGLKYIPGVIQGAYLLSMGKKAIGAAAESTITTVKAMSNIAASIGKMNFGSGRSLETAMASTERSRAISAMQNVGMSARSYLGQEAAILSIR